MNLETYLNSKLPSIDYGTNAMQKMSLKIFRQLVLAIGSNLANKKELSKESIQDYVMQKFFVTDVTAKRYVQRLIASKIFVYNEHDTMFRLPKEVEVTVNAQ